jgi:hypothetical protein
VTVLLLLRLRRGSSSDSLKGAVTLLVCLVGAVRRSNSGSTQVSSLGPEVQVVLQRSLRHITRQQSVLADVYQLWHNFIVANVCGQQTWQDLP